MIYGYARVSTKGQERCGNSLPEQEERIRQMYPTALNWQDYLHTE